LQDSQSSLDRERLAAGYDTAFASDDRSESVGMRAGYWETGESKGRDQTKRERTSFSEGHRQATSVSIYNPRILNLFRLAVKRRLVRARGAV
jgi:hypothetical protein